jgi:hypothetical protein
MRPIRDVLCVGNHLPPFGMAEDCRGNSWTSLFLAGSVAARIESRVYSQSVGFGTEFSVTAWNRYRWLFTAAFVRMIRIPISAWLKAGSEPARTHRRFGFRLVERTLRRSTDG